MVCTESAGGLDAVAHARAAVRQGCRVQVCGGTEAPISPYALTCQLRSGLLAEDGGYRPFARNTSGYLPGEGGAVVVLEDADHARERGASALGVLTGHAATFAGRNPGGPDDEEGWGRSAEALAAAIRLALADAALRPADIDVVFADGMGVPRADAAEADALRTVFGSRLDGIPVTVPKAGTGRAYSASAVVDLVTATLALATGAVPPTPGVAASDVAVDLDLVTDVARIVPLRHALLLARGFGGFTSALVLSSPERLN